MADGETFGLPIARVRTVFRIDAVTPLPLGPARVLGLVNLRGAILPLISLRRCLRAEDGPSLAGAIAVSLEIDEGGVALVVDDTGEVIRLNRADRIQLPGQMSPERANLTAALYRQTRGLLPILDLAAIFAMPAGVTGFDPQTSVPTVDRRRAHNGALS